MLVALLIDLAFGKIANAQPAKADDVLVSPTPEKLCLLYYRVAKSNPPIEDFANRAQSVTSSNEFDKAKRLAAEEQRINKVYNTVANHNVITISINMSFGEYDAQLGEYTLSGFGADMYVPFDCFNGTQLRLQFDNSAYAQSWSLNPSAAEQVLTRNKGAREVVAVSTIELSSAESASPGEPLLLSGHLRSVSIYGAYNHAPLGNYVVPDK